MTKDDMNTLEKFGIGCGENLSVEQRIILMSGILCCGNSVDEAVAWSYSAVCLEGVESRKDFGRLEPYLHCYEEDGGGILFICGDCYIF